MTKNRVKSQTCPNCDFNFSETSNYCPNCGQENHTHKLPIKHFTTEFLESVFHFDTKLLSTLRDLLLKPGVITENFNQNKRARYVPPIRLYIFISFIFFLLLSLLNNNQNSDNQNKTQNKEIFEIKNDIVSHRTVSAQKLFNEIKRTNEPSDSLIAAYLRTSGETLKWYNHNFYKGLVKVETGHVTKEAYLHRFYKNTSTLMFFMMPLFAFFLFIIYWRKKNYYTEHLIFSIHFHSLAFLMLSLHQIVSLTHCKTAIYFFIIIAIYFILSLHRVYQQGWFKTIFKAVLLGLCYLLTIAIALVLCLAISL